MKEIAKWSAIEGLLLLLKRHLFVCFCVCCVFLVLLKQFLYLLSWIFFSFLLKGYNKFAKICSTSFRQT